MVRTEHDGSLTTLVGTRIYWMTRTQGEAELPAIVMQKISVTRQVTNDGPNGLLESSVQFDCWGDNDASSLAVGRALIAAGQARQKRPCFT